MRSLSAAAPVLALLLASQSATAQHRKVELTLWGSWVHPSQTQTFDEESGTTIDFDNGGGAGVTVNVHDHDLISVEVGGFWWRTVGGIGYQGQRILDLGALDRYPVLLEAQFHPLGSSGPVDPYLGAGGAWVFFSKLRSGDLDQAGIGSIDVKSKLGFLGNVGVAVRVTDTFSLVADGRYLVVKPTGTASGTGVENEIKANTIAISGGARLRF